MAIDYAADTPVQKDQDLSRVAELAQRQMELEDEIQDLEEKLANKKHELERVQCFDLPDALRETGLSEVRLKSGEKLTVKDEVYASISQANAETAFEWLKEHGLDDIIKNDVVLTFKRGEENLADTIAKQLDLMGVGQHMLRKKHVHWQTLRATVKEQLELGVNLPMDVFGVHITPKTKIKRG